MALELTIVTPDRKVRVGGLRMLVFQTPQGETGLLQGHAPLIGRVDCGVARAFPAGGDDPLPPRLFATSSGFVRASDDRVMLLLERMLEAAEIDVDATHAELSRVEFARGGIFAELEPDSDAALQEAEEFLLAALDLAHEQIRTKIHEF